jgi:hypothetical protein
MVATRDLEGNPRLNGPGSQSSLLWIGSDNPGASDTITIGDLPGIASNATTAFGTISSTMTNLYLYVGDKYPEFEADRDKWDHYHGVSSYLSPLLWLTAEAELE